MDIVEQATTYAAKGYYKRERSPLPFWGALRPEDRHEVIGGRDFVSIDILQSVFGYFFGGGWVFGLAENRKCRIEAGSLARYESSKFPRKNLLLSYRVGDVRGQKMGTAQWGGGPRPNINRNAKGVYLRLEVFRDRYKKVAPVPPTSLLREIDAYALEHDKSLRRADEQEWSTNSARVRAESKDAREAANVKLLTQLRKMDWERKRSELDAARPALGKKLWAQMRRLHRYECFMASFAAEALDLKFDPDLLTPTMDEARKMATLSNVRTYSLKAKRPFSEACTAEPQSPRLHSVMLAMDKANTLFGPDRENIE